MASAMIERAEFPVQRKSTLKRRSVTTASLATSRRDRRSNGCRRYTACLGIGHAGLTLPGAVAVVSVLASRVEGLPRNTGGIVDPRFLRLGIAAGGFTLLDNRAARLTQAGINLMQFRLVLNLNPEMIEARFATACRDRKVYAWVIKHPFCIIRLHHGGLRI